MTAARHRALAVVVLVLSLLVVAGGFAVDRLGGLGALLERAEHLVHDETAVVRAPDGEYVSSVRGDRAVLFAVGDADGVGGARLASMVDGADPDRLLYLGDVYEWGSPSSFGAWSRAWGKLAERTAPTVGNHDWPDATEGYDPYWTKIHGAPPPTYYAFGAAGWDVVSINSEAPHERGSQQERWLRERVAAAPTRCRVVFWHRPRHSAGPHGDDASVEPLWRAIAGRARILVSGHEHNSQRLRARDGIVQFVAGAAGRELNSPDRRDPRLAFADPTTDAALRLDLRPGTARWSFVSAEGAVLADGTLHC